MYQTNYTCYQISGEDAKTFLQGQVTCDLDHLKDKPSLAAYCSPEGKVLGLFYLAAFEEGFLLITNDNKPEEFIKRLKMFILRAKVKIEPLDFQVYGTEDKASSNQLAKLKVALNQNLMLALYSEEQECSQSSNAWNFKEIVAGLPQLNSELRGKIIATFMNLDWLNAISYQKGCYVGQEVIARLHFRSTPAKRSFVYQCDQTIDNLAINQTFSCLDPDSQKTIKISIFRFEVIDGKTIILVEMNSKNNPRNQLTLNYNNQNYTLKCINLTYQPSE